MVGEAATDPDFIGGSDLVTYRMRLGDVSGGVSVFVELKYQTLPFGYLRDLRQDAHDPTVARFIALYDASAIRAETIATAPADVAPPGVVPGSPSRSVGASQGSARRAPSGARNR